MSSSQGPVEDTHGKNSIEAAGDRVAEAVHFVSDQNSQPEPDKAGDDAEWGTVPPAKSPAAANTNGRDTGVGRPALATTDNQAGVNTGVGQGGAVQRMGETAADVAGTAAASLGAIIPEANKEETLHGSRAHPTSVEKEADTVKSTDISNRTPGSQELQDAGQRVKEAAIGTAEHVQHRAAGFPRSPGLNPTETAEQADRGGGGGVEAAKREPAAASQELHSGEEGLDAGSLERARQRARQATGSLLSQGMANLDAKPPAASAERPSQQGDSSADISGEAKQVVQEVMANPLDGSGLGNSSQGQARESAIDAQRAGEERRQSVLDSVSQLGTRIKETVWGLGATAVEIADEGANIEAGLPADAGLQKKEPAQSKDPQHGSEQTGKGLVQEVEAAARSALDQLKDKLGHVEEKITPTNPIDASLADGKIPLSTAEVRAGADTP